MAQKYCSRCKQERSLFEFGKNKTTKDGLQKWCKVCVRDHVAVRRANKSNLSAKQIKDRIKIHEFGDALIRHNGVAYKAYREISNCKSDSSAAASCSVFLKNTNFPSQFTEYLKGPKVLNHILIYFEDTMENGTRTEKRDAIRLITQLNGMLKEGREKQNADHSNGIGPEERAKRLQRVADIINEDQKNGIPWDLTREKLASYHRQ